MLDPLALTPSTLRCFPLGPASPSVGACWREEDGDALTIGRWVRGPDGALTARRRPAVVVPAGWTVRRAGAAWEAVARAQPGRIVMASRLEHLAAALWRA